MHETTIRWKIPVEHSGFIIAEELLIHCLDILGLELFVFAFDDELSLLANKGLLPFLMDREERYIVHKGLISLLRVGIEQLIEVPNHCISA